MSETLTSQELKSLEEMPSSLEMVELRKITTLKDIPLAGRTEMQQLKVSHQEANEEHEQKLKTNSLKRFLRLPSKKKIGIGSLETERSEIDFETADMPDAVRSPNRLSGSLSKTTLKSSLSGYWNSMFKQKKTRKSLPTKNESEPNLLEASSSANSENRLPRTSIEVQADKCILDEIQSLTISQECPTK